MTKHSEIQKRNLKHIRVDDIDSKEMSLNSAFLGISESEYLRMLHKNFGNLLCSIIKENIQKDPRRFGITTSMDAALKILTTDEFYAWWKKSHSDK